MTKEDKKLIKKFLEKRVNIYNRADEENMKFCFTEGLKVKNREIKKLKEQIERMKAELHHRLVSPSRSDSDCLDKIIGLDRLWQFGQEF